MISVSENLGVRLLRDWGVDSWDGSSSCVYFLWEGCCVFSVIEYDSAIQVHMAMRKDSRLKCREASMSLIDKFSDKTIIAPILHGRISVENMVKKLGFNLYLESYINKNETVNIYVRYPDGFTN